MNRTYECKKCGQFEHYRKDSKIIDKCPTCGNKIKQVLGLTFQLRGPGFYSTGNTEKVL